MKTEKLVARADKKTVSLIKEAHELSGEPTSKIIRDGALKEAVRIISMSDNTLAHIATKSQQQERENNE